VTLAHATDACAADWNDYVRTDSEASCYHRYEWRGLISRVFGHDSHYLLARDGAGNVAGVLPLVRLRSRLFGDFLVSMPYFNYGGIAAAHPGARSALLEGAASLGRELGVGHVELRHIGNLAPAWPMRTDKVTMRLPLPATPEALNRQLPGKLRSQIKRPTRDGATYVSGGLERLDEFYAVFARNMRDLGTPVYPKRFFAAILETFAREARLFVVHLGGKPAAAGFVLSHGDWLEIPWASSLREFNPSSVNMLLYWSVLEYACNSGFRTFDFGRSTVDSGPYKFKRQWGAEPVPLHWHYWLKAGGEPPRLNPDNPKYRAAIALWQRLPVPVANVLGPLVVRNLP
jgi:FemAB-related protein (PEP-CTERM system-associated)